MNEVAEKKRQVLEPRANPVPSAVIDKAISQISELAVVVSKVEGQQNTDARDLMFSLQRDVMDLIETLLRRATKKEPTTVRP